MEQNREAQRNPLSYDLLIFNKDVKVTNEKKYFQQMTLERTTGNPYGKKIILDFYLMLPTKIYSNGS